MLDRVSVVHLTAVGILPNIFCQGRPSFEQAYRRSKTTSQPGNFPSHPGV